MNIEFHITDVKDIADAIAVLAYIGAGFDPNFPTVAMLAALHGAEPAQGSTGDKADRIPKSRRQRW
jgi:hypothetical protein